jgi:hypothetical protein
MLAIQTVIETYIRFKDERALQALKAHRLKLLATIDATDPFFRNLRSQCIEEISAVEAGLVRLRPPVVSCMDASVPQAVSTGAGHPSMGADAAAPPPVGDCSRPRPAATRTSDPSLIASSLVAAALAARAELDGTNPATELIKLQLRLATRLKGSRDGL